MGETDRYIVPGQVTGEVIYHDMARAMKEIGPNYDYMDSAWVPEADVHLAVRHVEQVPPDFKPYIDPHTHPVNQVYGISPGLTCEVILEGEKHEVTGPAGVFIPAGMMHTLWPRRGKGYFVVVTSGGEYV